MYNSFFGFKERPFMLVPNPAYLFLSRSHEEALAHLTYAVTQGDGFVEITGEVGTGKTTLCRVFLEKLDDSVEAAYIFNPMLNSVQLLKAVNSEFGVCADPENTKDLIDILNEFLIRKKAQGKKVIIVVDEAQNLSLEVLEQLRLLSNLETTTSKLLQIILVGQPELREKLDSRELRQLAQRITLSCHLTPMTYQETRDYIQHRLRVASHRSGPKFTRSAIKTVYSFSGGIPRLINIVCDRALLIAYGFNTQKISGGVVRASVRELTSHADLKLRNYQEKKTAVLLLSLLCAALLLFILYPPQPLTVSRLWTKSDVTAPDLIQNKTSSESPDSKAAPEAAVPQPGEQNDRTIPNGVSEPASVNADEEPDPGSMTESIPVPEQTEPLQLAEYISTTDFGSSRISALETIFALWQVDDVKSPELSLVADEPFFTLSAGQNGFMLQRIDNYDLDLILKLNLPSVFEIRSDRRSKPGYLTLSEIRHDKLVFGIGKDVAPVEADLNQLRRYWSGTAYIFWKNFYNYTGIIPKDAPPEAILAVKMQLREIGFYDIQLNSKYDEPTRQAIEKIQRKHNIIVDGVVGPLTKIILYNETKSLKIPHMTNPSDQHTGAAP